MRERHNYDCSVHGWKPSGPRLDPDHTSFCCELSAQTKSLINFRANVVLEELFNEGQLQVTFTSTSGHGETFEGVSIHLPNEAYINNDSRFGLKPEIKKAVQDGLVWCVVGAKKPRSKL